MGFQNSINSMLGTVGAAAALGKHMQNQEEQLVNQEKELAAKEADAKEGLINTADEVARLGGEYLTKEERLSTMNEDGTVKADEALEMMGKKTAEGINNGSIELQKGREALTRMKQLRAARAKFKFILGDKTAFDYQDKPNNKETR